MDKRGMKRKSPEEEEVGSQRQWPQADRNSSPATRRTEHPMMWNSGASSKTQKYFLKFFYFFFIHGS